MSTANIDWAKLREPFPKEKHKSFKGRGGQSYTYVDARDIMDRLDEVCGPENWSDEVELLDAQSGAMRVTLTIAGVSKSDIGYPNNPIGAANKDGKRIDSDEPLKEAVTDGIRRSAVHWGICRYLYQNFDPRSLQSGQTENAASNDARMASPANEKLIDEATEALRVLSGVRHAKGKELILEANAELDELQIRTGDFSALTNKQLTLLRDWAKRKAQEPALMEF